jgi:hypothetical protein
MDHKEQHHQHHHQEREEKKHHERERELREQKQGPAIHPLWFLVLGAVATLGAVLTWILY